MRSNIKGQRKHIYSTLQTLRLEILDKSGTQERASHQHWMHITRSLSPYSREGKPKLGCFGSTVTLQFLFQSIQKQLKESLGYHLEIYFLRQKFILAFAKRKEVVSDQRFTDNEDYNKL